MRRVLFAALIGMFGLSSPAMAASDIARPHLFVMGSLTKVDSNRNTESSNNGWQIGLGYPLTDHLYVEGIYFDNVFETGDNQGSDYYQRGGGLDLHYSFGDRESFTPFILGGIGGVSNDVVPDSLDEDSFYANVGAGFVGRLFNLKWLRYRAEVRYIHDDYLDGMGDVRGAVGLEVALGETSRPQPRERVVEKVVYKEVPARRVDSDGDGVEDSRDNCPNTLPGARVDARGCVIESQTINIDNVTFETNSAELTLNAKKILGAALAFLQSQPNLNAEIAGHTDNVGAAAYNLQLSQRRAESVRAFLIRNGIAARRTVARGYGETSPIANNSTATGREANRRVELRLIPR